MGKARKPRNTDRLEAVADSLGLDVDQVIARADAVLADPLYWFPVRHHSPAVARYVEAEIRRRKPKVIFIEGPPEANHLVKHVADSNTRPPIAIYSSYRDDDNVLGLAGIASPAPDIPARFASWYPLVSYSPEYVAIKAATKIKADVVFMDLPHYGLLQGPDLEGIAEEGDFPEIVDDEDDEDEIDAADHKDLENESDRLIVDSSFYQKLAEVAGFRSWNEGWDSIFETGEYESTEAFRRELAVFCSAVRATTPKARTNADGTLERERHMWQTIQSTLDKRKLKAEQAMVICGGFHLFLDREDETPPPELPDGTVYATVMPYSYFRLSELSGYAAGNRAPNFYQTCHEMAVANRSEELLPEHIVSILKQARKKGENLSTADAISAAQHARMLASLRGRAVPVLDDIQDAIITCCCKGNPQEEGSHLLEAMDAVNIGNKVGKVTSKLGRLPIVEDFHTQLRALELENITERETKVTFKLDKREPDDARKTAFFHRLKFLGVPLGTITAAPSGDFDTGMIFREAWSVRWSPKVEPALIEKSLHGDSIQTAVLTQLQESIVKHRQHAGKTCESLLNAIDMDLPEVVGEIQKVCGDVIDTDVRFVSLCEALQHLTVLERYAEFRELRRDVLEDLIIRCYDRACFAIPDAASVPEQQQSEVVAALNGIAELILRQQVELDRDLFVSNVKYAVSQSTVPFLRGAFIGMLAEIKQITTDDLAAEISAFSQAPVDQMILAGDFLEGVMAVSRTSIMLGADTLVEAINQLLEAAPWEAFRSMLPRLRRAFEQLHSRQLDSLAERVAVRYGLSEDAQLTKLDTSVAAASLLARVDQQVAEIMKQWEF